MRPLAALVFKIQTDPYIGRLAYIRVYSGVLRDRADSAATANKNRKERIGRLVQVYAEKRQEVTELRAGDIGAVVGLKQTFTGETLVRSGSPDRARSDRVPGAGDFCGGRAARPRPTRTSWPTPCSAWPTRTRPSGCAWTSRPARP